MPLYRALRLQRIINVNILGARLVMSEHFLGARIEEDLVDAWLSVALEYQNRRGTELRSLCQMSPESHDNNYYLL